VPAATLDGKRLVDKQSDSVVMRLIGRNRDLISGASAEGRRPDIASDRHVNRVGRLLDKQSAHDNLMAKELNYGYQEQTGRCDLYH
jgi:hypothetical protein